MIVETLSTFPAMFASVMESSIMGRAQAKGLLQFSCHDLRDWTHDRHRSTDDEPYGGGQGLVMKCAPIFEALDELVTATPTPYTIFLAPWGDPLSDEMAEALAARPRLLFICGHYEGIDERAYTLADQVISIGDYVLTSGELAAMVVIDAVVRKIDGVLGDAQSAHDDSFSQGLLEFPHYTRPASFRDLDVPPVLLSGNHQAVERWRHEQSLRRTWERRPDLLGAYRPSRGDAAFIAELERRAAEGADELNPRRASHERAGVEVS